MNKMLLLFILLSFVNCSKKETSLPEKKISEFSVIDSHLPLFIDKIDFEHAEKIQLNDEINSKIRKTAVDFYNNESGVDGDYKKYFRLKDCYFKTIRLLGKYQTAYVIILKYFPADGLTSRILFYDNTSKQFVGEPLDFKIYALYDFDKGELKPNELKHYFKIQGPEIKINQQKDGKSEFEFTRLWHNGTFNAIESTILEISKNKIDTLHYSQTPIGDLH